MFTLFTYNTSMHHSNNTSGKHFIDCDKFIGRTKPTLKELKSNLKKGDYSSIKKVGYFPHEIRGSDNYWRARTGDFKTWIQHHVTRGHGPPVFYHSLMRIKLVA